MLDSSRSSTFELQSLIRSTHSPRNTANLDASSIQPNGVGIELQPLRINAHALPSRQVSALEAYEELIQQEKEKRATETLLRVFGDGAGDDPDMKFSHSLQFNAVPDWSNQYIAYSNLKKLIYSLEKEVNQRAQKLATDAESSPLLHNAAGDPDKAFSHALDVELDKINGFYQVKEAELFKEVDDFLNDEDSWAVGFNDDIEDGDHDSSPVTHRRSMSGSKGRRSSLFQSWGFPARRRTSVSRPMLERIDSDDSDDEADEHTNLKPSRTTGDTDFPSANDSSPEIAKPRRRTSAGLDDMADSLASGGMNSSLVAKKRMIHLYVSMCELKSFGQLNKTGFTKVLKKYDKTLDRKLKSSYVENRVGRAHAFQQPNVDAVSERINRLEQAYARLATQGDVDQAKRELRLDLREHVVW